MKHTPQDEKIAARLLPGVITLEGFMGADTRHFTQIIADDAAILASLQLSAADLGAKLQHFTEIAFELYNGPEVVEELFELEGEVVRGKLPCPFGHPGAFRKGTYRLKNLKTGAEIHWTPLGLHLIQKHGFFGGVGSKFRMEPELVARALGLV